MKTRTRTIASQVSMLAAIGLVATACVSSEAPGSGDAEPDTDDNGTEVTEDAAEPGDDVETTTARFAYVYDPSHPVGSCGVPAIQDGLEGSGIAIDDYPAAQLGNEAELLEQVASGGLELAVAGPSFLGVWHEEAAMFDAPFLFRDVDHFQETLDGPIAEDVWGDLAEESGLNVLASWYYGTRHVTSNMEVNTSADLQGVTLRAADAPLYLTMAEIMGGSPTPMALDEVYLALQQGTIDAQENPIPTIASQGFHEVQDYINLTGHMIQGVMVVTSDQYLDSLSDEDRTALEDAMVGATEAVRDCIEQQENDFLEEWRETGEITVNDNVDLDHFRERAMEIVPENFAWGDLYLEIQGS